MEQTYTDLTMIRLIYGETDIVERLEIEDAIENNSNLRNVFQKLYYSYKSLPKVLFRPSKMVVESILNYSNAYHA